MIRRVRAYGRRCSYQVRTREGPSKKFSMARGFREGGPASPVEFNVYHARSGHRVRAFITSQISAA
eukprot:2795079-Pyramimonas_sp.AAC.1